MAMRVVVRRRSAPLFWWLFTVGMVIAVAVTFWQVAIPVAAVLVVAVCVARRRRAVR